uniref:Uncharacterized protein n=1 Tax=Cucumis melo TaxID=3656 RepID=A0A9I9DTT6_CUCME
MEKRPTVRFLLQRRGRLSGIDQTSKEGAKLREVPSIRSAAIEVASSLYRVSALVSALE